MRLQQVAMAALGLDASFPPPVGSGERDDLWRFASVRSALLENNENLRSAQKSGILRLGTTDAFFLDRLAGTFATDTTTASRTSLMNLETGGWDPELYALFGVPIECLPEIRSSIGFFGEIEGTPVTASLVDQQAALYGHGCRKAGDTKIPFGTGAFALAVTGDAIVRSASKGLLATVAWSHTGIVYAVDGGVYDAGAAVEWATSLGVRPAILSARFGWRRRGRAGRAVRRRPRGSAGRRECLGNGASAGPPPWSPGRARQHHAPPDQAGTTCPAGRNCRNRRGLAGPRRRGPGPAPAGVSQGRRPLPAAACKPAPGDMRLGLGGQFAQSKIGGPPTAAGNAGRHGPQVFSFGDLRCLIREISTT